MERGKKMEKNERFILVEIYKDNNIKTMIGSFDSVCKEVEYQLNKIEENKNHYSNIVSATIYDRKYSDETIEIEKELGIKAATTTQGGISSINDGLYQLKRVRIYPMSIESFASIFSEYIY